MKSRSIPRVMSRLIFLLFLTGTRPGSALPSSPQDEPPPRGTPEKEYSRRISKDWDPLPSKVVANLKALAGRSQDSGELILRQAYHLLNASIVGKEWGEVWPHLKGPELFDVEMWSARQASWYYYRFGLQRKAWTSPGGISHDLVLELTVDHEVVKGRPTRRSVRHAKALLRADVKATLEDLRLKPRYAPESAFQIVVKTDASPPRGGRPLPYLAVIEANYEPYMDRWSELWSYAFQFRVEIVDAVEAPVQRWNQSYWVGSNLDPLLTSKMEVLEGREQRQKGQAPQAMARGGSGSSPGGDSHGFRRLDLPPGPREGC